MWYIQHTTQYFRVRHLKCLFLRYKNRYRLAEILDEVSSNLLQEEVKESPYRLHKRWMSPGKSLVLLNRATFRI